MYNRQASDALLACQHASSPHSNVQAARAQVLAQQQQSKTQRAFVEYQRAHDAHAEAKAAVAALEQRLMASSGACAAARRHAYGAHARRPAGGAVVDTDLLSQCSDLASRVVETESAKLRADHVHAIEARYAARNAASRQGGPNGGRLRSGVSPPSCASCTRALA